MTPAELGLPPKFSRWRKGQYEAIVDVATRPERFIACAMPTGAGKSAFYIGLSLLLDVRTLVLTANKGLQNQLADDFAPIGMTDIRGQANYRCVALDSTRQADRQRLLWAGNDPTKADFGRAGTGCDHGPCRAGLDCSFRSSGGCLYYDQVAAAKKAQFVVTNYDYWMTQNRYGDEPIGKFGLLVLDESHEAADRLSDFCSVRLNADEVSTLLGLDLPPVEAGIDYWCDWAKRAADMTDRLLQSAKKDRKVTLVRRCRDLLDKLKFLASAPKWKRGNPANPSVWMPGVQNDWVAEKDAIGITFSPVWAHGYAEEYLFARTPKVLMVSATLMPGTLKYLGVTL